MRLVLARALLAAPSRSWSLDDVAGVLDEDARRAVRARRFDGLPDLAIIEASVDTPADEQRESAHRVER